MSNLLPNEYERWILVQYGEHMRRPVKVRVIPIDAVDGHWVWMMPVDPPSWLKVRFGNHTSFTVDGPSWPIIQQESSFPAFTIYDSEDSAYDGLIKSAEANIIVQKKRLAEDINYLIDLKIKVQQIRNGG